MTKDTPVLSPIMAHLVNEYMKEPNSEFIRMLKDLANCQLYIEKLEQDTELLKHYFDVVTGKYEQYITQRDAAIKELADLRATIEATARAQVEPVVITEAEAAVRLGEESDGFSICSDGTVGIDDTNSCDISSHWLLFDNEGKEVVYNRLHDQAMRDYLRLGIYWYNNNTIDLNSLPSRIRAHVLRQRARYAQNKS